MSAGKEYLDERNAQAVADRLEKAAAFVRIHAKSPLFQKRMGRYLVRVEWPGVLIVADPETGAVCAQSEPGNPTKPQAQSTGGQVMTCPSPSPMPAILAELAICNAKGSAASDSLDMPATHALLADAAKALSCGIPYRFEHGGRTFYLRVSLGLTRLEVFDTPTRAEPLCLAMYGSFDTYGYSPGP